MRGEERGRGNAASGREAIAVDFNGDRALEEIDAQDHAPGVAELEEDAFEAAQGAVVDIDVLADLEERPGIEGEAGSDHGADGGDFGFWDRGGVFAEADDPEDTWDGEDAELVVEGEAAENIAGEERELELLDAVGPVVTGAVEGEEILEALIPEGGGGFSFVLGLDGQGEPRKWVVPDWHGRCHAGGLRGIRTKLPLRESQEDSRAADTQNSIRLAARGGLSRACPPEGCGDHKAIASREVGRRPEPRLPLAYAERHTSRIQVRRKT